ncbi:MAG: cation:proton antiporter [Arcobacter butzleri]|jgi:Kef-type K+ transport system membrane component KefB|nr:cation:proton antiporter [Arcobacteraceae bacterium]NLO16619.1 cation:proton antiporter [Aliarcobacter butzleri]
MDSLAFLSQIVILILLAPIFAKLFRLSISVVEIILGALVVWLGFIDSGNELFYDIAKIGFFYLMFLAGLEINIKKFVSFKDKFIKNVLIYFSCLYGISFFLYFVFDLNPVYIVAIPIVSLGMIMALINEHGKEHKWLELSLIIGVIGELISISALVIFDGMVAHGIGEEFYKNIAILIVILIVTFYAFKGMIVLFWWFPRLKRVIMPESDNMSQDIRVSMALFFILIAIMQYLHIDMVLGAFIAGVFIANFFEHKVELPHILHRVGFGFLVPLFFIYVGTTLNLSVLFTKEILVNALLIVLAMVFARIISSFVAYYKYLGAKDTVLFSFGDSMPLTFLIAIATIAINNNALTQNEYYAFILAAIIEAVFIMILIKYILEKRKTKQCS